MKFPRVSGGNERGTGWFHGEGWRQQDIEKMVEITISAVMPALGAGIHAFLAAQ